MYSGSWIRRSSKRRRSLEINCIVQGYPRFTKLSGLRPVARLGRQPGDFGQIERRASFAPAMHAGRWPDASRWPQIIGHHICGRHAVTSLAAAQRVFSASLADEGWNFWNPTTTHSRQQKRVSPATSGERGTAARDMIDVPGRKQLGSGGCGPRRCRRGWKRMYGSRGWE
ncbi:hypothetical protein CSOJ01_02610 [Colletotrichum sojae]|uniref:Uncharacterized protein n=1 Tax=Colletotrichum sojae TaxID=2175907 RepID=A0A8H6N2M0_9PEZI|nr:hypothetical protein CSOJ01_02610 [Colletotrichum sojae]